MVKSVWVRRQFLVGVAMKYYADDQWFANWKVNVA